MKVRIKVYGRVQGVFFRANTKKKALELGLKGWIMNKKNGSVELMVEGKRVKEFIEWCKEGPDFARVDKIETKEEKSEEKLSGFEIRY